MGNRTKEEVFDAGSNLVQAKGRVIDSHQQDRRLRQIGPADELCGRHH
jgi:hypothetical protein